MRDLSKSGQGHQKGGQQAEAGVKLGVHVQVFYLPSCFLSASTALLPIPPIHSVRPHVLFLTLVFLVG